MDGSSEKENNNRDQQKDKECRVEIHSFSDVEIFSIKYLDQDNFVLINSTG